jgi:hypothetical protein
MGTATGKYGFRYVTLKPRRIPIEVGTAVHTGNMDVPGRVDIYVYTPTDVDKVQVVSSVSCAAGLSYGFDDDSPNPDIRTPGQLCFAYSYTVDGPIAQDVIMWSDDARTGRYSFSLQPA